MLTLHDLVRVYVDNKEPGSARDPQIRDAVLETMENKIRAQIINEEAEKIQRQVQEERRKAWQTEQQEKLSKRMREAGYAFWVAIALALVISLLGNQVTDVLSQIRLAMLQDVSDTAFALFLILLLIGVTYVIYDFTYLRSAYELIEDFIRKEHDSK